MSRRRALVAVTLPLFLLLAAACGDRTGASTAKPTTTAKEAGAPATKAGAAVPSPGCGTTTPTALNEDQRTIDVDGTPRTYLLTTPPQADSTTPVPLVVDFHGYAEGATIHAKMSGNSALAQQEGFVVAYPQGLGSPAQWNVTLDGPNQDFAFVDRLLTQLGTDLCIDTSRVYAEGLSMGAWMSSALACARPEKFAAIAPVAGVQFAKGCDPDRAVPVLAYHGTADPILFFNGGIGDLKGLMGGATTSDAVALPPADLNGAGHPANVKAWAKHNGCDATPKDSDVSATVVHRVYTCPTGADVEFYIIKGGGHSWPGSAFSQAIAKIVGPTNMDIDASKLNWEFFRKFQLRAAVPAGTN